MNLVINEPAPPDQHSVHTVTDFPYYRENTMVAWSQTSLVHLQAEADRIIEDCRQGRVGFATATTFIIEVCLTPNGNIPLNRHEAQLYDQLFPDEPINTD